MISHNDEIDKIDHQLTEDDSKLIPTYQHTTYITWCDFSNIHRTNSRSHTYTDTTQDTIEVENDKQSPVRLSLWQDVALWFH